MTEDTIQSRAWVVADLNKLPRSLREAPGLRCMDFDTFKKQMEGLADWEQPSGDPPDFSVDNTPPVVIFLHSSLPDKPQAIQTFAQCRSHMHARLQWMGRELSPALYLVTDERSSGQPLQPGELDELDAKRHDLLTCKEDDIGIAGNRSLILDKAYRRLELAQCGYVIHDVASGAEWRDKLELLAVYRTDVLLDGPDGVGKQALAQWMHASSRRGSMRIVRFPPPNGRSGSQAAQDARSDTVGLHDALAGGDNDTVLLVNVHQATDADRETIVERIPSSGTGPWYILTTNSLSVPADTSVSQWPGASILRMLNVQIPALKDRPQDIVAIARGVALDYSRFTGVVHTIDPDGVRLLRMYPWKENVRSLKQVVESACAKAGSKKIVGKQEMRDAIQAHRSQAGQASTTVLTDDELWHSIVESNGNLFFAATALRPLAGERFDLGALEDHIISRENLWKQYADAYPLAPFWRRHLRHDETGHV
jgi:glycerol-3-phosphate cytidylyltransferase-like family protein